MKNVGQVLELWHVISFVPMSIPLFNLIVVNERVLMGTKFNFSTDDRCALTGPVVKLV